MQYMYVFRGIPLRNGRGAAEKIPHVCQMTNAMQQQQQQQQGGAAAANVDFRKERR